MSKTNETLDSLKGRKIIYKGSEHTFKNWSVVDGQVHILTDNGTIRINKSEISEEIKKLYVSGEDIQKNGIQKRDSSDLSPSKLETVDDILMETIEKVRSDSGYVNQAKAINASVSNLVSVQRLKIQMMKERDRINP